MINWADSGGIPIFDYRGNVSPNTESGKRVSEVGGMIMGRITSQLMGTVATLRMATSKKANYGHRLIMLGVLDCKQKWNDSRDHSVISP